MSRPLNKWQLFSLSAARSDDSGLVRINPGIGFVVLRDIPRALGFQEDLPSADQSLTTKRLFEQILRRAVELCGEDPGEHTMCENVNAIATLQYFAKGMHQQPARLSDDKQRMDSNRARCVSAVGVFALRRVLQLKIDNAELPNVLGSRSPTFRAIEAFCEGEAHSSSHAPKQAGWQSLMLALGWSRGFDSAQQQFLDGELMRLERENISSKMREKERKREETKSHDSPDNKRRRASLQSPFRRSDNVSTEDEDESVQHVSRPLSDHPTNQNPAPAPHDVPRRPGYRGSASAWATVPSASPPSQPSKSINHSSTVSSNHSSNVNLNDSVASRSSSRRRSSGDRDEDDDDAPASIRIRRYNPLDENPMPVASLKQPVNANQHNDRNAHPNNDRSSSQWKKSSPAPYSNGPSYSNYPPSSASEAPYSRSVSEPGSMPHTRPARLSASYNSTSQNPAPSPPAAPFPNPAPFQNSSRSVQSPSLSSSAVVNSPKSSGLSSAPAPALLSSPKVGPVGGPASGPINASSSDSNIGQSSNVSNPNVSSSSSNNAAAGIVLKEVVPPQPENPNDGKELSVIELLQQKLQEVARVSASMKTTAEEVRECERQLELKRAAVSEFEARHKALVAEVQALTTKLM